MLNQVKTEFLENKNVDFGGSLFSTNNIFVAVACPSYNLIRVSDDVPT